MLLLDRTTGADEALDWGLVNELAPPQALTGALQAAARRSFIEAIVGGWAREGVERFLRDFSGYPCDDAPA